MIEEEISVTCPTCGSPASVEVDILEQHAYEFTQDCPVCCGPWIVHVAFDKGRPFVRVEAE